MPEFLHWLRCRNSQNVFFFLSDFTKLVPSIFWLLSHCQLLGFPVQSQELDLITLVYLCSFQLSIFSDSVIICSSLFCRHPCIVTSLCLLHLFVCITNWWGLLRKPDERDIKPVERDIKQGDCRSFGHSWKCENYTLLFLYCLSIHSSPINSAKFQYKHLFFLLFCSI